MLESILVTGGAGFIGSCFVRRMVSQGRRVVNLDKLTYAGNLDSLASIHENPIDNNPIDNSVQVGSRYVFVQGDICDRELVSSLLAEHRLQAVVHFAAESHVDRSIENPSDFVRTNALGTFELLQAARDYWSALDESRQSRFRFLHISTDEVFGSLGPTGAFTESSPYAPNSPYSASKAAADHFVRAYFHTFGLPVLTTHCSNNYGPYQFPEKLIPLMILNAIEGKPLPVYGDGQNVRDWVFVEDHCEALEAVLDRGRPAETYHIGGDCERTNLEIVRTVCAEVDRQCPGLPHAPCEKLLTFVEDRPGHDRRYAMDIAKIRRELDWKPRQSFETGLSRTVAWYLANKPWVERITSGVYRRQRLGLASKETLA